GWDDEDAIVANRIGLLLQPYEATAGLISNALLTLARRPEFRSQVEADLSLLGEVVSEVLRYDSPVQNNRRFIVRCGMVAGRWMKAGDVVLVVLAAANRDPVANPDPDRFDIYRNNRKTFSFGVGAHACPGEALAHTIAMTGIKRLIASGFAFESLLTEPP